MPQITVDFFSWPLTTVKEIWGVGLEGIYQGHQSHSPVTKQKETSERISCYRTQSNNQQKLEICYLIVSKVRKE